jgi:hypothetical protein
MTRHVLLPVLVAFILASPFALAAGPDDRPGGGPPGSGEDRPGGGPPGDDGDGQSRGPPEDRAYGLQRANERRAAADARGVSDTVGAFNVANTAQRVDGAYVSFDYGPMGLGNVTAQDLHLFDVDALGATASSGDVRVQAAGVQVRLNADAFNVQVHDNPGAVFKVNPASSLTFHFPAGTILTHGDGGVSVMYDTGEEASLLGPDFTVNGTRVDAEGPATFLLNAKRGAFDHHRGDITNAITRGHVGAEVTVARGNGHAAEDAVTFGTVTVGTHAEFGNVTLTVEGQAMDGRVIIANVEPALFNAAKAGDLNVHFDGEPATRAESLIDVLNPREGMENAEYWVVEDLDGYQVIFSLPHYSVHTLSILDAFEEVPPSVVVGLVASVIVIAAGGFVLFRRPQ